MASAGEDEPAKQRGVVERFECLAPAACARVLHPAAYDFGVEDLLLDEPAEHAPDLGDRLGHMRFALETVEDVPLVDHGAGLLAEDEEDERREGLDGDELVVDVERRGIAITYDPDDRGMGVGDDGGVGAGDGLQVGGGAFAGGALEEQSADLEVAVGVGEDPAGPGWDGVSVDEESVVARAVLDPPGMVTELEPSVESGDAGIVEEHVGFGAPSAGISGEDGEDQRGRDSGVWGALEESKEELV